MIRGRRWGSAASAICATAGLWLAIAQYSSSNARDVIWHGLYSAEPAELIAAIEQLWQNDQQDSELTYQLAVAHRRAGKTNRARQLLETARRLGWSRKDIQRQEYLIRLQSGEIKASEDYLLALTAGSYPDDEATEIYECLSKSYLANMQLSEANAVLWHWRQWRPGAVGARRIKAELLAIVHDFQGEMREYQDILRITPDDFDVRMRLGHRLLNANDLAGALEQFEACVKLRPTSESASLALAICFRRTGDVAKAKTLLQRVLEADPHEADQALGLFELGQIALMESESQKAIEYFERAMKLAPDMPRLNYAYGVALTRSGKTELGNSYLQKSTEFDNNTSRFIELMDEIARHPDSANLRCEVGRLALALNNRTQAYRWLSSALRCDPHHKASHQELANYYTQAGRQDLAQQHLAMVDSDPAQAAGLTNED